MPRAGSFFIPIGMKRGVRCLALIMFNLIKNKTICPDRTIKYWLFSAASGDLTKRKLLPSLFELFIRDFLPSRFVILGAARSDFSDESFRAEQKKNLLLFRQGKNTDEEQLDRFLNLVYYLKFDSDKIEEYHLLKEKVGQLRKDFEIPDQIVFYLATPPMQYGFTAKALQKNGMNKAEEPGGWRRIVVEKPFGRDLQSAQS